MGLYSTGINPIGCGDLIGRRLRAWIWSNFKKKWTEFLQQKSKIESERVSKDWESSASEGLRTETIEKAVQHVHGNRGICREKFQIPSLTRNAWTVLIWKWA